MKIKKTDKNIFTEGYEENRLHPFVSSSYNFINEDVDDDMEVNNEGTPETPEPGVETGYSNLLIDAINGEWDTIALYNSIIANLSLEKDKKYDAIIKVLQDITNEENVHVGQLQKALELLSPNTTSIADGEKEAQEQISADDYDDEMTESYLFEADEENVEVEEKEETSDEFVDADDEVEEEEKSDKDKIKEFFEDKTFTVDEAVKIEKLFIENLNDGTKEVVATVISDKIPTESITSTQLKEFETKSREDGAEVSVGEIAKKYGMKKDQIFEQLTKSPWSDRKVRTALYSLSRSVFEKPEDFIEVSKKFVDNLDEDKYEEIINKLEEIKK